MNVAAIRHAMAASRIRGRIAAMSDNSPKPKRSKWWAPPDLLKSGAPAEIAPLIVLGSVGWAIAGLFRSLYSRRKSFGLRHLFFLMTGVAVLLGLIALAIN